MKTLKEGDQAPNFSVADQDGNIHTLEQYKGKKLILFSIQKQVLRAVRMKLAT